MSDSSDHAYAESVAILALIKDNMRLLIPSNETEVVTYRKTYGTGACVVEKPDPNNFGPQVQLRVPPLHGSELDALKHLLKKTQARVYEKVKDEPELMDDPLGF